MKRILYFILTNIAVVATVTILAMVFNVEPYLTANGINYTSLAIMSLLWGMTGSVISLLISRWSAKRLMGVKVFDGTGEYRDLVQMVHGIAQKAGMKTMPEVGVYNSPTPNAFATGRSQNSSLVAVSTGLLNSMDRDAVEGVLAHEVAHIINGDMVTMTLIQGVVNAFVIFISRIIVSLMRDDKRGSMASYGIYILCQMVFGFLGSMVTAAFSRHREFRADYGSARLVGKKKMVSALKALQGLYSEGRKSDVPKQMQALQISGGSMMALLSTHPPLEKRVIALESRGDLF